jgi:hypothetical protein
MTLARIVDPLVVGVGVIVLIVLPFPVQAYLIYRRRGTTKGHD